MHTVIIHKTALLIYLGVQMVKMLVHTIHSPGPELILMCFDISCETYPKFI